MYSMKLRSTWLHRQQQASVAYAWRSPSPCRCSGGQRRASGTLGSSAMKREGRQNLLCDHLSEALPIRLSANAVRCWWWAYLVSALLIAVVAVKAGWETWQGDPCCNEEGALLAQTQPWCDDDCCPQV